MLAYEKELLGFYVTGHPLDEYRSVLESGRYTPVQSLSEMEDKATVHVAGALTVVEKKFTKKDGKPFAIATLEDLTGSLEVMIWNDAYNKCATHLEQGRVVAVTGRLDKREESARIMATEIKAVKPGAPVQSSESAPVVLSFEMDRTTGEILQQVKSAVEQFPGTQRLELEFVNPEGSRLRMQSAFGVRLASELREKLAPWLSKA